MRTTYNNLTIRNAEESDSEILAKWWNDGAVMAHAGFPNGLGTTAEKIAADIATDSDDTRRRLIIELDGTPIGEMSYHNLGDNIAEIGIKICDFSQQEKGYGRVLLSMLISTLFHDYGYKKIVLDTNLKNSRAQHVYEKLGFRKLRVNVDAWKDQVGQMQSVVDYELLPEEFNSFVAR
jgi:RimJ/RimL family protein N-acetyltransferase